MDVTPGQVLEVRVGGQGGLGTNSGGFNGGGTGHPGGPESGGGGGASDIRVAPYSLNDRFVVAGGGGGRGGGASAVGGGIANCPNGDTGTGSFGGPGEGGTQLSGGNGGGPWGGGNGGPVGALGQGAEGAADPCFAMAPGGGGGGGYFGGGGGGSDCCCPGADGGGGGGAGSSLIPAGFNCSTSVGTGNLNNGFVSITPVGGIQLAVTPASATICQGLSVDLTISGASSYVWSPSQGLNTSTGASVTAGPNQTQVYSVIGTEGACADTAFVTVTVVPYPILTIDPANPSGCNGDPVTLTASGAAQYTWSPATGLNTTNGPTVTATIDQTTTYTVTGTTSGCSTETSVTVAYAVTVDLDEVICSGETFTLADGTVVNSSGNYSTVLTSSLGCDSIVNVNLEVGPNYNLTLNESFCQGESFILPDGSSVSQAGSYISSLTSSASCDSVITVQLSVNPLPGLNLGLLAGYCPYQLLVPLSPSPSGGTLSGVTVSGQSLDHTNLNPGTYSVSYAYTDANGCSSTTTGSYVLASPVQPGFTYELFCNELTANNTTPLVTENFSYEWFLDDEQISTQKSPVYGYDEFGQFDLTLTVTDAYNCSYSSTQIVDLEQSIDLTGFFFPNIITPNGDGVNDTLKMTEVADKCLDYNIEIFNRWGQLVFEMTPESVPFSGKNEGGNELSPGVYYYVFESKRLDCETTPELKDWCRGTITIIRD